MPSALIQTFVVGLGGACGAVLRFVVGGAVHRWMSSGGFPYGTLVVNLVGCFLIGWLIGLSEVRQLFGPSMRGFLLIGFLGGFTTFSTFGYETFAFLREQQILLACVNVSVQVILGVALVALGYVLSMGR